LLRTFIALKSPPLLPGLNPRTLGSTINVALVVMLRHAFNFCVLLCGNKCTETKDCSLIRGLLVLLYYAETRLRVNASQIS
jgi:hypothetical protein